MCETGNPRVSVVNEVCPLRISLEPFQTPCCLLGEDTLPLWAPAYPETREDGLF